MSNLNEDAKTFHLRFNAAVQKSAIRKTSQEKDAKILVSRFQKLTEEMLDDFKRTRKGDDLPIVLSTADQVEKLVSDLKLEAAVASSWEKIRTELGDVSRAFGMHDQNRQSASFGGETNPASCLHSVGAEKARRLVEECMQVSPATHPPCNAQNSCGLIVDEIKRSCELLGRDAPAFCEDYR